MTTFTYHTADAGDRIYLRASKSKVYQSFNPATDGWATKPPSGDQVPAVVVGREEYVRLIGFKAYPQSKAPRDSFVLKETLVAAADLDPPAGPTVEEQRAMLDVANGDRDAELAVLARDAEQFAAEAPAGSATEAFGQAVAKAAKRARKPRAPKAIDEAVAARPKAVSAKAQREADLAAGKVPSPPDFSANTHKPYRKRLEALVALVEAGDIHGLENVPMLPPRSSSPKALQRYRDGALIALKARAAEAS